MRWEYPGAAVRGVRSARSGPTFHDRLPRAASRAPLFDTLVMDEDHVERPVRVGADGSRIRRTLAVLQPLAEAAEDGTELSLPDNRTINYNTFMIIVTAKHLESQQNVVQCHYCGFS